MSKVLCQLTGQVSAEASNGPAQIICSLSYLFNCQYFVQSAEECAGARNCNSTLDLVSSLLLASEKIVIAQLDCSGGNEGQCYDYETCQQKAVGGPEAELLGPVLVVC